MTASVGLGIFGLPHWLARLASSPPLYRFVRVDHVVANMDHGAGMSTAELRFRLTRGSGLKLERQQDYRRPVDL